jgi:hypothetical protein
MGEAGIFAGWSVLYGFSLHGYVLSSTLSSSFVNPTIIHYLLWVYRLILD